MRRTRPRGSAEGGGGRSEQPGSARLGGQRLQAEVLEEACERELTRLMDLRSHHAEGGGLLVAWLDHEIAEIESRRAWFKQLATQAR